jgi:hypothetical protein
MRGLIAVRACSILLFLGALAAGFGAPVSAQSIFGINFLGENQFIGSGRYRSLGLSLYATFDSVNAVSANLASTADLPRLTFSVLETAGLSNVRNEAATAYENRFQFPSVAVGFPLRRGLVFALGYRTRFEGRGDMTFERPIEGAATGYEVYRHRSGLFSVPLSLAWRPVTWARVGGAVQFERGAIRDDSRVLFYAKNYDEAVSTRERSFSGTSWSVSALVQPHPRLCLGAGLNTETAYRVDETFTYTRAELDSSAAWDFTLPLSWEAGATVGFARRWWLSAHLWERAAPHPDGFPQLAGSLGSERLIAFGIERRGEPSGSFFTRIPLRAGFYEDRWHLEYPEGRPVRSRFITFGTGFALPGGPGVADVSFEIGQIGSIGSNGLDERVFRVSFGLSASESWSKRKTER